MDAMEHVFRVFPLLPAFGRSQLTFWDLREVSLSETPQGTLPFGMIDCLTSRGSGALTIFLRPRCSSALDEFGNHRASQSHYSPNTRRAA
jgi:hypothetical protein